MNKFNEIISALSDRLDTYHIPHTVHDCWDGAQIRFPWCDGNVAIHSYTCGHTNGYVEFYRFPEEDDTTTMLPEEALEHILILYVEQMRDLLATTLSVLNDAAQPLLDGDEG
jgi:hypothetical protein